MAAFHRLRLPRPSRLDGTAKLVLYNLCWRHDLSFDAAWPSTAKIAADLDIHRSAVCRAISRLTKERLITRHEGGGRGHSTRYRLNFLAPYWLAPDSEEPIVWVPKLSDTPDTLKVSYGPDSLESETVRQQQQKCPAAATQSVRPIGHEKNENNKSPEAGTKRASGREVDRLFERVHQQRKLALLGVVPDAPAPNPETPAVKEGTG